MKAKNVVIWIVVAVVLILVGAGLIAAGVSMGGATNVSNKFVNIKVYGEETYTTGNSEKYKNIKNIDIEGDNIRVEIVESADDTFYVEYSVSNQQTVPTVADDNGTLKIRQEERGAFININLVDLISGGEKYIRVYVPTKTELEEIDIDTSNGSVQINGDIIISELNAETNNGAVKVNGVTCQEVFDVKTSNGAVKCDGTFYEKFNIKTSNGAITLKGTYKGDVDVKTSNGKVNAEIDGKFSDYNVSLDTSNGSIVVNGEKRSDDFRVDHDAEYDFKIDTSNGSIDVDFE